MPILPPRMCPIGPLKVPLHARDLRQVAVECLAIIVDEPEIVQSLRFAGFQIFSQTAIHEFIFLKFTIANRVEMPRRRRFKLEYFFPLKIFCVQHVKFVQRFSSCRQASKEEEVRVVKKKRVVSSGCRLCAYSWDVDPRFGLDTVFPKVVVGGVGVSATKH